MLESRIGAYKSPFTVGWMDIRYCMAPDYVKKSSHTINPQTLILMNSWEFWYKQVQAIIKTKVMISV